MKIQVLVAKKQNLVTIDNGDKFIAMTIQEAYMLASDLLKELDKANPLLAEPE